MLYQKICCILCFSSLVCIGTAQTNERLCVQSYKYPNTKHVFNQLCTSLNLQNDTIKLVLWKNRERPKGAWYADKYKTLNVEEKLYDLCASYGADSLNALAFVISHELTHHRQKKAGGLGECILFNATEVQFDAQKLADETEADIQGLLTARIAGFRTIPLQDFIQKFYAKFNLPEVMPNYPTKLERLGFFEKDAVKANQAYALFCAALHLLCANEPDHAITALEHLYTTEKLTAPEVANNLITAYLQRVQVSLQQETDFGYRIPLALDSYYRGRTDAPNDRQTKRRILLNRLDTVLQRALTQMPNDSTLQINKALHTILDTWNEGKKTEAQALIAAFNADTNLVRYGTIDTIRTKEAPKNECQNDEKELQTTQSVQISRSIDLQQNENEWLIAIQNGIRIKGTDGKSATDTTACGIRIGSTVHEIENAYGAGFVIKTSQHDLYLYKNGLLCFYVQNGVVMNWSLVRL